MFRKKNYYLDEVETIYPLDLQEMQALFPDAAILREKFMGLTKSWIAMRK